jgi:hypothetical protein
MATVNQLPTATTPLDITNDEIVVWQGTGASAKLYQTSIQSLIDLTSASFKTIAIDGQTSVEADAAADTLTFVAGTNMTLTTSGDTITFTAAPASGPVSAIPSATDNAIVRWDGTDGATLQDGIVRINDTGVMTGLTAVDIDGATSGTIKVQATAIAGSRTITLPAATGTVVLKDTTDTLTNKTIDASNNTVTNVSLATGVTGDLPVGNLNSGTSASASTFWRGDGTWAAPAGAGDMLLGTIQNVTAEKNFDSATLVLNGATSGDITLNATAVAGTNTLTLPAATDTLIGKATTDTLTNKTFDANGTGNSLSNVDVADLANGTDGELITWDAAGAPATVTVGTLGHVLTSNGAGAAPTFQAAGAGDMLLGTIQTVTANKTFEDTHLILETAAAAGTTTLITASTGTKTITLPDATDTLVGKATTDTLTNKSIAAGTNTLTGLVWDTNIFADGTDGTIPTFDASGEPTFIAAGGKGKSLISAGAGAEPVFAGGPVVNAKGSLGATPTIDLDNGRTVSGTVNTTMTSNMVFSNPESTGTEDGFTLYLTNGGAFTTLWPTSVKWASATAPSLTASGVDILVFTTIDGGTTWYGFVAGLDMS